jgi:hypothetical protein
MEEAKKPEPKISEVEAVLITIALAILEIISAFFLFIGPYILLIISPILNFYLKVKGLPSSRFVITQLIELVPILNEFPMLTVGFAAIVYMDRHPKGAKLLGAVGAVGVTALTGGAGGVAAAGASGTGAVAGGVAATEGAIATGQVAASATASAGAAIGAETAAETATGASEAMAGARGASGSKKVGKFIRDITPNPSTDPEDQLSRDTSEDALINSMEESPYEYPFSEKEDDSESEETEYRKAA